MSYIPFDPENSNEPIVSLNDYVENWGKNFPEEAIYFDVEKIKVTEQGFVLYTSEFSVFCSHKFRKVAKTLAGYVRKASSGEQFQALAVGIPGTFSNGYADWYMAKNTDLIVTLEQNEHESSDTTQRYTVIVLEDNQTEKPPSNPDPVPPKRQKGATSRKTTYKAK